MRRRVITSHFDSWVDPAECFSVFCGGEDPAFWLDSGKNSTSGMSCLGRGARVVTHSRGLLEDSARSVSTDVSVFEFLRSELSLGTDESDEPLIFPLGWVGWLGYELHESTLNYPAQLPPKYPDAAFLCAERAVVFDHAKRTVTLVALGESWSGELALWRDETFRMLDALKAHRPTPPEHRGTVSRHVDSTVGPVWAYSDDEYLRMIEECQDAIHAGDAYQLCLTTEVTVDAHPDPMETYLRLRELSPSHHGGFLRVGGVSLLSSSPEKFLTVSRTGTVESKPIKGTRRRGATTAADVELRAELLASEKERAENLMIVDLVRNDLSRVCALGSVTVPHLLEVESYAQVHQLVSTVQGTLAAGCDGIDAVQACFPAGSMTGAPKRSAVAILASLERRPRGLYAGAWGYFGFDGSVDLAMTIRSIVIDDHGSSIGTGGGITALSVPSEELDETKIKAAALLLALGLVNS